MKEFNRLFNAFTVLAIVIMLLTTVVAASITVIEKGESNLYSVNVACIKTKNAPMCRKI